MNEKQALDILIQGVEIGQKKGIYELQDAAIIYNAVEYAKKRIEEINNDIEK